MVGIHEKGSESTVARVSLVNYHGHVLLDTFVQPREKVTDYRTWVSGVRASDLEGAPVFDVVQKQVNELVEGRTLVGHAIENDLKVRFDSGRSADGIGFTTESPGSDDTRYSEMQSIEREVKEQDA